MKFTVFWRKFSVIFSIFGILIFVNNVRCEVEGIVDVKYDGNDHDAEAETLDNIEADTYDFKNPRHRRIYAGQVYKEMFEKHRLIQHEATKAVTKFGNYEKRYQLVSRMLAQIFDVFEKAKQNTTIFELNPGDLMPEDEEERVTISKIYENVFLFGDLMLRMPDLVHSIYDRHKTWRYQLAWALEWCELSNFFDGPAKVILEIISQEGNIKPKYDEWKPDYRNMTEVEQDLVQTYYERDAILKQLEEAQKLAAKNEKKEKKKVKKGPRMSREDL